MVRSDSEKKAFRGEADSVALRRCGNFRPVKWPHPLQLLLSDQMSDGEAKSSGGLAIELPQLIQGKWLTRKYCGSKVATVKALSDSHRGACFASATVRK